MQGLSNKQVDELGLFGCEITKGAVIATPILIVTTIVSMNLKALIPMWPVVLIAVVTWLVVKRLAGRVERVSWTGPDYNGRNNNDD